MERVMVFGTGQIYQNGQVYPAYLVLSNEDGQVPEDICSIPGQYQRTNGISPQYAMP